MAPHSSTLAWRIPWTEGPGGLQSMVFAMEEQMSSSNIHHLRKRPKDQIMSQCQLNMPAHVDFMSGFLLGRKQLLKNKQSLKNKQKGAESLTSRLMIQRPTCTPSCRLC